MPRRDGNRNAETALPGRMVDCRSRTKAPSAYHFLRKNTLSMPHPRSSTIGARFRRSSSRSRRGRARTGESPSAPRDHASVQAEPRHGLDAREYRAKVKTQDSGYGIGVRPVDAPPVVDASPGTAVHDRRRGGPDHPIRRRGTARQSWRTLRPEPARPSSLDLCPSSVTRGGGSPPRGSALPTTVVAGCTAGGEPPPRSGPSDVGPIGCTPPPRRGPVPLAGGCAHERRAALAR
jgi:hypothetical protein